LTKYEAVKIQLEKFQNEFSILGTQLQAEQNGRREEGDVLRQELTEKDACLQRLRKEAEENLNEKRLTSRMYNATLKVAALEIVFDK
jgi:hypothetical protein